MSSRVRRPSGAALRALLALSLAASCAVDQKKEVASYRSVLDRDAPRLVQPPSSGEELTLERALVLANQKNEQLAIEGEDYLQALIERTRAVAAFLPTITFQASELDRHGERPFRNDNRLSAPFRFQMNVFNGFRDVALLQKAEATADQRRALLLDLQASLLLSVSQAYYLVLRFERQVDVLRNSLAFQGERIHDMEERRRLGIVRSLDLAQTKADEAATRVTLAQAESNVINGRTALAFLIGMETVDQPLADEFQVPPSLPSIEELLQGARDGRQDLQAARHEVEAARHGVEAAVREYLPSASVDLRRFVQPAGVWTSLLSASIPIFSAGLIQADIRTAWSDYRKALLRVSLLERQGSEGVRIAFENLITSQRKLVVIEAEVTAAKQAYDLSTRSYQLGGATNLDRLTAQDRLLNAELDRARVSFDVKLFYLDLLREIGQFGTSVGAHQGPPAPEPSVDGSASPDSSRNAAAKPAESDEP